MEKILKNPNDKLIAIDLDGVLCEGEFWGDGEPVPIPEMITSVREWYVKGAHIIIYTARQPKYYAVTLAWLIKHEVPFHGIAMFVKPGADIYIDDKCINSFGISEQLVRRNSRHTTT
jgi:uncharacterized HAD superfamily protein